MTVSGKSKSSRGRRGRGVSRWVRFGILPALLLATAPGNLSNDDVTDAGLAHVARVTGLAGLNLTGTKITDAGLVELKRLPKLTKLNVTGTAVTEHGVKDAKKFLPFWATVTR